MNVDVSKDPQKNIFEKQKEIPRWSKKNDYFQNSILRIFQRFRLVKFIEKFKTRVKNLKIEKMIASDKYLLELFFAFYFHLSKNVLLTLKK